MKYQKVFVVLWVYAIRKEKSFKPALYVQIIPMCYSNFAPDKIDSSSNCKSRFLAAGA